VKPIAAALVVIAAATLLAADFSEARRMSGGRSFGAQRPGATPTQPAAPPSQAGATTPGAASNPVMPPAAGANAAKAAPAAAAAPPAGRSWLGPIAGLAAGLGLAALASHLGFSEELGSFLLLALGALAVLFVVRLMMSRRETRAPMPYAGAGAGLGATPGGYETQVPPPARFEPTAFGGPPLDQLRKPLLPAGFDAAGFAREAKKQFLAVQTAHDRQDAKALG